MARFHQGKYRPKNPEKYVGKLDEITYRQQWEKKFMHWADTNPSVIKWNSEEAVINYISPLDQRPHRYFVDFVVMIRNRSGEIKKYAVEIKPEQQCLPPKSSRNKKRMITETETYLVNQAKWKAAQQFFSRAGIEFMVLTEKHLGIK